MGGDPKGGRVCWPGSSGVQEAYRVYEQFFDGNVIESSGSPFNSAAKNTFNFGGWDIPNLAFSSGDGDAANINFTLPDWYLAADSTITADILTTTLVNPPDNTPVPWNIYGLHFSHGDVVNPAFAASTAFNTVINNQKELVITNTGIPFNGAPSAGDWIGVLVEREATGDTNPDLQILLGINIQVIRTYTP